MDVKAGDEVFASSPATDWSVEKAKEFIRAHGWTRDDVSLCRLDHAVTVTAKRPLSLEIIAPTETFKE